MSNVSILVFAVLLGMQSNTEKVMDQSKQAVDTATQQTQDGIGDALLTPLSDLNLKRREIPPLLQALESAYAPLPGDSCEGLAEEVMKLNVVLGPDLNEVEPEPESIGEKAGSGTSKAVLDTVSSTAGSIIPLRGIVRTVSGASKRDREFAAAIRRGYERRAFLKGAGTQLECEWPASALMPDASED